jgi:hypothetical protein
MKPMKHLARIACGVALCGAAVWSGTTMAASHREAPLIANDPTADNTDFYMFRSWTNPGNVVFILNAIPVQEPSGGPNYFNFGDDVLYKINVDTNADGKEDLVYEIRFKTDGHAGARRRARRPRHEDDVCSALARRAGHDAGLRRSRGARHLFARQRRQGLRRAA